MVYRLRLLNASTYRLHLVTTRRDAQGTVVVTPQHDRVLVIGEVHGWNDVIRVDPGNVVEVAVRFDIPGRYVYHCHILEH